MSSNSKPYPKTVGALKTFADEVGTYPLRVLLVAGYVYDDTHEFADDITDELSGSGYARVDLDNVLYAATDSDAAITADDTVFASLTATGIDGVIVISDQGADSASPLVGYFAIGPLSVSTETLTVPWPSGQVAYFTTRDALTGEGIVQTIVAGDNITVDDTDPANPVVSATGGGSSGPLDAEQFDRTSTTPGAISVDLSSVTKAGAVIFVDGASDVTVTALPDSSAFPVFFVYVARITGTGVCTLTFDGGAPVYDGDQYTATSEANGQAAIGLVPLGSGENWLVDSVFPAAGGTDVAVADGGTGASTASGARTNLGLVIGTDVEAHDADLTTIGGLSPSNDDFLQRKSGAWTNRTVAQVKTDLGVSGPTVFGDGSDGAVTYSSNTTLTRNIYCTSLQVNSGVTVSTDGFGIWCTGTATIDGTISNSAITSTGAGPAALVERISVGGGTGGAAVGGGATGGGLFGLRMGGTAGAGGSGTIGGGGAAGTATAASDAMLRSGLWYYTTSTNIGRLGGGPGGGGGGQGAGWGAVGGGGGGGVALIARAVAGSGSVLANAAAGTAAAAASTAGGGGGGGGGFILLQTASTSHSLTLQANGGAGGAGNGAGNAGSAGGNGRIIQILGV